MTGGDDEVRSSRRQMPCDRQTDPGRGAGDKCRRAANLKSAAVGHESSGRPFEGKTRHGSGGNRLQLAGDGAAERRFEVG